MADRATLSYSNMKRDVTATYTSGQPDGPFLLQSGSIDMRLQDENFVAHLARLVGGGRSGRVIAGRERLLSLRLLDGAFAAALLWGQRLGGLGRFGGRHRRSRGLGRRSGRGAAVSGRPGR